MQLSKKLQSLLPESLQEIFVAFDPVKDHSSETNIRICHYFNDDDLKESIAATSMDYLTFPLGFRWPILSNDTSFALVYLDSFDNPQDLQQKNLEVLVQQFKFSMVRINKILLELESLSKSYNKYE